MKGSNHPDDSPLDTDGLPSYDYATAQPPAEGYQAGPSTSSATASASTAVPAVSKNSLHLFSGPPNAEPLFGHIETTLGTLGDIVTSTKRSTTESRDPKLGNGMSYSLLLVTLLSCQNTDRLAEILYDFLRYRSRKVPGFKMQCTGSHWVHHDHNHTVFENGSSIEKRKGQSELIVDFDFYVRPPLLVCLIEC
jgi:hypothetical protein